MDEVFRALADPTRRELLDRLRRREGQTLLELAEGFDMTRQAVTKHLDLLVEARLVTVDWRGRERLHYLNPVPLARIAARWMDRFARRRSRALVDLKSRLEEPMQDPEYVYEIYIKAQRDAVWEALTEGHFTRQYWFATSIESSWQAGAPVRFLFEDGRVAVEGEVLEADRPARLSYTWHPLYDEGLAAEVPSRVTFELEEVRGQTRLRVVHDRFPAGSAVRRHVAGGWEFLISGLKSVVESGGRAAVAS
ncbi:MAG: hypothetical protein AMJ58_07445 [Gammaproteobacteria bacterium SG8_30]|jgi:uncharacterized protein YndB with AHSA1/START domain/DNA-binding transcriptional ArsR family regulator|nr:MAG: hypothetical protein AMJ58_07445 [Gammaproteobacteria bacterium SG8_30]